MCVRATDQAGWPGKLLECYELMGVEHSMNATASQVSNNLGFGANIQLCYSSEYFRLEEMHFIH